MRRMTMIIAVGLVCLLATGQFASAAEKQKSSRAADINKSTAAAVATVQDRPKAKFWDLRIAEMQINGQKADLSSNIAVELDKPSTFTCIQELKMPPLAQITEADIKYWGSGNFSYAWEMHLEMDAIPFTILPNSISKSRITLPKFTSFAQLGPNGFAGANHPSQHTTHTSYTIKSTDPSYQGMVKLGKFRFCCEMDTANEIAETDEANQSRCVNFHLTKKIEKTVGAVAHKVVTPDVIIKGFSLNPAKVQAGMPFDLIIEFWNRGTGASSAGQKYTQSCKVRSGGSSCPVAAATGTLPHIPANGTQKVTLAGLRGKEGSYEVTVSLMPKSANNSNFYIFPIGPVQVTP